MGIRELLFTKKKNQSPLLSAFYAGELARWEDIYRGGGEWRYTRRGGINGGMRKVAALNAAKAVCAELSRLCFTEGTQLVSSDKETEDFVERVLRENSFADRFPDFLEKVFALGGGAVKVYWDGGIKVDLITADRFVPTCWDGRGISGAAFGSRLSQNGKSYILAETQELTHDGCVTENRLFTENGGKAEIKDVLPELMERSVIKGLTKPLFVYLGTGSGNVPKCPPLGASVFAGAEDTLKSIDTIFDSLNREFVLGRKRIIVPYYAIRGEYDENGELKRYFDVNDEVFQALSTTDAEELRITDNTATLRVTEHTEALGALLDILCMQVGLSEGALSYKNGTIKTATEVVSRDSRTYRTRGFYRKRIAECLAQAAENICILGKMSGQLSAGASEKVSLVFADGVCEDEGTRIERAVSLYNAGIISRVRAISQIYGVSLDEARSMERSDFYGQEYNGN